MRRLIAAFPRYLGEIEMASPMRIRATMMNGATEVKVLMSHPMETGLRKLDRRSGARNAYQGCGGEDNDKVVLQAEWGGAVSQNPFLQFRFFWCVVGDAVSVTWNDNKGETHRSGHLALTCSKVRQRFAASLSKPSEGASTCSPDRFSLPLSAMYQWFTRKKTFLPSTVQCSAMTAPRFSLKWMARHGCRRLLAPKA